MPCLKSLLVSGSTFIAGSKLSSSVAFQSLEILAKHTSLLSCTQIQESLACIKCLSHLVYFKTPSIHPPPSRIYWTHLPQWSQHKCQVCSVCYCMKLFTHHECFGGICRKQKQVLKSIDFMLTNNRIPSMCQLCAIPQKLFEHKVLICHAFLFVAVQPLLVGEFVILG